MVDGVESDGFDLDEDVIGAGLGSWAVLDCEGCASCGEDGGLMG